MVSFYDVIALLGLSALCAIVLALDVIRVRSQRALEKRLRTLEQDHGLDEWTQVTSDERRRATALVRAWAYLRRLGR